MLVSLIDVSECLQRSCRELAGQEHPSRPFSFKPTSRYSVALRLHHKSPSEPPQWPVRAVSLDEASRYGLGREYRKSVRFFCSYTMFSIMALLAFPVRFGFSLFTTLITISMARFSRLSAIPALPPEVKHLAGRRPFLWYGLRHSRRPDKSKHLEQIEAIMLVFVPAPVLLADLPAYLFSQWPPAHVGLLSTSWYVTHSKYSPCCAWSSWHIHL